MRSAVVGRGGLAVDYVDLRIAAIPSTDPGWVLKRVGRSIREGTWPGEPSMAVMITTAAAPRPDADRRPILLRLLVLVLVALCLGPAPDAAADPTTPSPVWSPA